MSLKLSSNSFKSRSYRFPSHSINLVLRSSNPIQVRMPKRKDESEDFSEDLRELDDKPVPKKKQAAAKAKKADGGASGLVIEKKAPAPKKLLKTEVDWLGWTCVPPSLIHRDYGSKPSTKIAAFDLDGTLIMTKSGADFAKGPDDWKFFNKKVPSVIKELEEKGYKIVIFSNQGGIKGALTGKAASTAKGKADQMLKQTGVQALVMFATGSDDLRKPNTGMWETMCKELNGGVQPDLEECFPPLSDLDECFYVGDAAGRPTDFKDRATGLPSDTDRKFAENIGISFKVPEDMFGKPIEQSNSNLELVAVFKEFSDVLFERGVDKDKFRAAAFKKVATALAGFEAKIDGTNLKAVNDLPGVGKGSMGIIKEWLETGKVQELEDMRAARGGGASIEKQAGAGQSGPKTAAAAVALKFM